MCKREVVSFLSFTSERKEAGGLKIRIRNLFDAVKRQWLSKGKEQKGFLFTLIYRIVTLLKLRELRELRELVNGRPIRVAENDEPVSVAFLPD